MKSRLDQMEEDRHFADAERMLGKLDAKQGNELSAYGHFAKALKYREGIPAEARSTEDHAFIAKCYHKLSIYSAAKYAKKKENYLQAALDSYAKIVGVVPIANTPEAYADLTKSSNNLVVHQLQQGEYEEALNACDRYGRLVIKQDQLENFDTLLRNGMFLYWKVWDRVRELEEKKSGPLILRIINNMMELALEMKAPEARDCHFLGFFVLAALLSGVLIKCDDSEKTGHYEFVVNAFTAAEIANTDDAAIRHNALLHYLMYICFMSIQDVERMHAALNQAIALRLTLKDPNTADLEMMTLLRQQAMPGVEKGSEVYQAATEECAKRMIHHAECCVREYLEALEEIVNQKNKKRPTPMTFFPLDEDEAAEAKCAKWSPPPSPPSSCPTPSSTPSSSSSPSF